MNILDTLQQLLDDSGQSRWAASATSKRRFVIGARARGSKEPYTQASYHLTPIYCDTDHKGVIADVELLLSGANVMPDLIALGRLALRIADEKAYPFSVEDTRLIVRMREEIK